MRDSKPRIVEREILDQVSEEVLIDPMQNNEVVRPAEVVDEEVDSVIDEGARANVAERFELTEIRSSSVTQYLTQYPEVNCQ